MCCKGGMLCNDDGQENNQYPSSITIKIFSIPSVSPWEYSVSIQYHHKNIKYPSSITIRWEVFLQYHHKMRSIPSEVSPKEYSVSLQYHQNHDCKESCQKWCLSQCLFLNHELSMREMMLCLTSVSISCRSQGDHHPSQQRKFRWHTFKKRLLTACLVLVAIWNRPQYQCLSTDQYLSLICSVSKTLNYQQWHCMVDRR